MNVIVFAYESKRDQTFWLDNEDIPYPQCMHQTDAEVDVYPAIHPDIVIAIWGHNTSEALVGTVPIFS